MILALPTKSEVITWPLLRVCTVVALIGLISMAALFAVSLYPLQTELDAMAKQHSELQQRLITQQHSLTRYEDIESALHARKREWNQFSTQLFPAQNSAAIVAVIDRSAFQAGVILNKVEWIEVQEKPQFRVNPLQINLIGRFQDLLQFFQLLANEDALITVDKAMVMRESANSEQLKVTLWLSAYQSRLNKATNQRGKDD